MCQIIEDITYEQAKEVATDIISIKEHECMFVNTENLGYSVLVFKNGRHIHYANDYEIHHRHLVDKHGYEKLKETYINEMYNRLFTNEELSTTVDNYDEYRRREHFLRNYWIMRYEHKSAFYINDADAKDIKKAKKKLPLYNPISFCYVAEQEIIDLQKKYLDNLKSSFKKMLENPDTFRNMIHYELCNHEACISCDYTPALYTLGLKFETLTEEQKQIVKEELRKETSRYDY